MSNDPRLANPHDSPFNLDDAVRERVSAELVRAGVLPASLPSLFAALDRPLTASSHRWSWLHTPDALRDGAALVLLLEHGAAHLTTAIEAAALLRSPRPVIVIDVGEIIANIERQAPEAAS